MQDMDPQRRLSVIKYSPSAQEVAAQLRAMLGPPPPASPEEHEGEAQEFRAYSLSRGMRYGKAAYVLAHTLGAQHIPLGAAYQGVRNVYDSYATAEGNNVNSGIVVAALTELLPWEPYTFSNSYKFDGERHRVKCWFFGLSETALHFVVYKGYYQFTAWPLRRLEFGDVPTLTLQRLHPMRRAAVALAALPLPEEFEEEHERNPWPAGLYASNLVRRYTAAYAQVKALAQQD